MKKRKWKHRKISALPKIKFEKVGDRVIPTTPPIRRMRFSSKPYDFAVTIDDGNVTVTGTSKEIFTPSITGRKPKNGKLELGYTFVPLAGEEDLDEIKEGIQKAKATTVWLKENLQKIENEEYKTSHGN